MFDTAITDGTVVDGADPLGGRWDRFSWFGLRNVGLTARWSTPPCHETRWW